MVQEEAIKDETIKKQPQKKPLWHRIAKWIGITAISLIGLFILICALMVWILTPDRLTPLVEKQASKYLDADVKASKIELTFWKTFPQMHLDIDSLQVVSRSLDGLSPQMRQSLPVDADSLLYIRQFHGGINVLKLLVGKISLHDVTIDSPRVNLLQVNDSIANYQIVPPSESDTTHSEIPSISINRFEILNAQTLRFRSLADSLDVTARLQNVSLRENGKDGTTLPEYQLTIDGDARLPFLKDYDLTDLRFGIDGRIDWSAENPYQISIKGMNVKLDEYAMAFDAIAEFADDPKIMQFSGRILDLPVQSLIRHLPADMKDMAKPLKTDMLLSATIELSQPWVLADTILPSARATLSIPSCRASYQNLNFTDFAAELAVDFDGGNLDRSRFDLKRLHLVGEGVKVELSALATNVETDPFVDGKFSGSVNLSKIPPRLASEIPVTLAGIIEGDTDFRFALSQLNEKSFHKINASGHMELKKISAQAEGLLTAALNHGEIRFGTTDSFLADGHKVDSLLQMSLKIDTLSASGMGMNLEIKDFKAGAGTVNRASSADTTEINPFGGTIAFQRLKFDSPSDSMRVHLRDTRVGGALRRYKGEGRAPLIDLRVNSSRMMFGQALNRFSVSGANMALTLHPNQSAGRKAGIRRHRSGRATGEPADSQAVRNASTTTANANIDLRLDREDRRLLRRWDWKGSLRASKGRVVTPYFPLRNRLENIDLTFNTDSILLRNLSYHAGQSDFLINGTISNLRKALTSRTDNTLGISFDVRSDTINVNEIVKAIFAGPAIASQTESAEIWGGDDDSAEANRLAEMADTAATGPLLLPKNIDAHLRMRANHILYSDMQLSRFRGNVLLYDGAINLRNLSASTEIGSLAVNGLYSGADPDSLQFGLGMKVNNFRIDRLTSIVPAIDSLLPSIKDLSGIVNADIAVTTNVDRNMDINIPSLNAAIKIEGDSLVLLDSETFKTISKWLLFKNKNRNMIDHMAVEIIIEDSQIELFPFMFDIDRYRLGVMGYNDMAMNLNYHVSVLKSPIPFKFGINVKGTPDKPKIRLGRAKFKENMVSERSVIADNTRVNLVQQMENVFRKGVRNARLGRLNFNSNAGNSDSRGNGSNGSDGRKSSARDQLNAINRQLNEEDTLSPTDSVEMINAGLLPPPPGYTPPAADSTAVSR